MSASEATPKPRRRWFRFSLRTLLLFSFLSGSVWLAAGKREAWRLEYVLESAESPERGRKYKVGDTELNELRGKRFTFYRNDKPYYTIDFFETFNEGFRKAYLGDQFYNQNSISTEFSPDLTHMLLADGAHACLYDIDGRRQVFETSFIPRDGKNVREVFTAPELHFSNDGRRIAVTSANFRDLILLDARSGRIERCVQLPDSGELLTQKFSPDGKTLLVALTGARVLVDVESGNTQQLLIEVPDNDDRYTTWLADAPHTLAVYAKQRGIALIDSQTGRILSTHEHGVGVDFDGFSGDGRHYYLIVQPNFSPRGQVHVADTRTGATLLKFEPNPNIAKQDGTLKYGDHPYFKTASHGDFVMTTNSEGDTQMRRISSGLVVGDLKPRTMTTLPPPNPRPVASDALVATLGDQPALDSKVLAIKPDVGLVMLSSGSNNNVQPGYRFIIKGKEFKGTVQVDKVYPDMSSAKIVWPRQDRDRIAAGDNAAQQMIGATMGMLWSNKAILVRPFGLQTGMSRDYILRRNHPEEWWGLACTGEFWLAAALLLAFLWSAVRDVRGLPRAAISRL